MSEVIYAVSCAATVGQVLPAPVLQVLDAHITSGVAGVYTALTPVTAAPAAGQVQFTGTPHNPLAALTLSVAPTLNDLLIVRAIPIGGLVGS